MGSERGLFSCLILGGRNGSFEQTCSQIVYPELVIVLRFIKRAGQMNFVGPEILQMDDMV